MCANGRFSPSLSCSLGSPTRREECIIIKTEPDGRVDIDTGQRDSSLPAACLLAGHSRRRQLQPALLLI